MLLVMLNIKTHIKKTWEPVICLHNNKHVIVIPVDELADIETWDEQRSIHKDHLNELRNETADYKDLDYGYHVAELVLKDAETDETIRKNVLIDGQHRRRVRCFNVDGVRRIFGLGEYVSIMYYPNRTRIEICELFRNINKSKPILFKDTTYKYQELLSKCQRMWPSAFKTGDSIKRPRITTAALSGVLKKTGVFCDGDEGWTVNEVLDNIISINLREKGKILAMDEASLKKIYKLSGNTIKKIDKDCNGFYLGVDEKYGWAKSLCSGSGKE
jgi:hypothetical protein